MSALDDPTSPPEVHAPARRRPWHESVLLHAGLWLVTIGALALAGPPLLRHFADHSLPLPGFTALAVRLVQWLTRWWYIAMFMLALTTTIDAVITGLLAADPGRRGFRLWDGAMIAMPLAVLAGAALAFALPFFYTMHKLDG